MQETEDVLRLFRRATRAQEQIYLATVVHVQGSSYRKPGARMLVTSSGERAGHISGGCLEAEVSRRISWLTRSGSVLETYSSSYDDDNEGVPYGLGCGGSIWILMESGEPVWATLQALEQAHRDATSCVLAIVLYGSNLGTVAIAKQTTNGLHRAQLSGYDIATDCSAVDELVKAALTRGRTVVSPQQAAGGIPQFVFVPLLPPPHVTVFGAGDDAQPLVRLMGSLGWKVVVADGRGHLVTKQRFPEAFSVCRLQFAVVDDDLQGDLTIASEAEVISSDFAVVLTHSYAQDRAVLKHLLPKELSYLGLLGPLHRTKRLVTSLVSVVGKSFDMCMSALNAPVGLRLGSDDPTVIAISIVSEMQAVMTGTTGMVERKDSAAEFNRIASTTTTCMKRLTDSVMTHKDFFERELTL